MSCWQQWNIKAYLRVWVQWFSDIFFKLSHGFNVLNSIVLGLILMRPSTVQVSCILPLRFRSRAAKLSLLRDLQSASFMYIGHLDGNSMVWSASSWLRGESGLASDIGGFRVVAREPGRRPECCSGGSAGGGTSLGSVPASWKTSSVSASLRTRLLWSASLVRAS